MIDFFVKGGPLMWPILTCSVLALALIVVKALQFYVIRKKLAQGLESVLARPPADMAELIEGVASGKDREQLALIGTRQVRELEKGLGALGLIASIAPLLGLTGTVTGMIQAFMAIASHTGSRVEPSMVAGGIYEALITTAAGLFVAVPTHVALHFLEGRLDGIALRMKALTLGLRERRNHGV
ncbi:MAG: MotA/TolQ/ExbB proton channel family protein [Desulfobacterales bacterium]|jgi:biopolymer transport protein ExbB|nr:MotA/TolQ/ExbB proton channel family protein [Desulfobacterales bacterium]